MNVNVPLITSSALKFLQFSMESFFRLPLFDLRGTRKVEIRHTKFLFSTKNITGFRSFWFLLSTDFLLFFPHIYLNNMFIGTLYMEEMIHVTFAQIINVAWVCIHQVFSRTFFICFSKICKFECNTTSD